MHFFIMENANITIVEVMDKNGILVSTSPDDPLPWSVCEVCDLLSGQ
jgi:hypothetical protein